MDVVSVTFHTLPGLLSEIFWVGTGWRLHPLKPVLSFCIPPNLPDVPQIPLSDKHLFCTCCMPGPIRIIPLTCSVSMYSVPTVCQALLE